MWWPCCCSRDGFIISSRIPTGVRSRRERATLSITFDMRCPFSPSSIEGRKALFQARRREQGPLRHWLMLREVTVRCYLTSKASHCPMKLSRFINHEFFQSYKSDNRQQTTSYCLVKSEDELWTDLVRAQAGWITAQFLRELCKVMVHHEDEPIGAQRDQIWGENIWVSQSIFTCDVLFLLTKPPSCGRATRWIW
jgi:hypothetical protein